MRASWFLLLLLCAAAALPATASSHGGPHSKFGVKAARVVKRVYLPPAADTDKDGLSNGTEEHRTATNPRKFDTDGDGFGDGAEVIAGSNPRDPASTPAGPPAPLLTGSPPAGASPSIPVDPPVEEPPVEEPPVEPPPDKTPPNTSINSSPPFTTTSTSAEFTFSSTESPSTFKCSLDSQTSSSCVSPVSYGSLSVGPHTFSVVATDAAGNADLSPAKRSWTVTEPGPPVECTTTLSPGANLSTAVSNAAGGEVICLSSGSYSVNVSNANKSSMVTIMPAAGATPTLGYSILNEATNLRFQELKFTGGIEALGPASHLQFANNEFSGPFGIHANGQQQSNGTEVTDVLIEGNYLHDLDYTGSQGAANGYGVTGSNGVSRFTILDNTIKSPASDYIQSASPVDWVVDHNTFLGPSLLGTHEDHQDLWQIFGGGENVTFTNNVARDTETQESLLFQEGAFSNVVIENNLFDHDSRGYTCQLYQSTGLVFRDNTIVGSHWGCLFRDLASAAPGSGYEVDHNVFAETEASVDVSEEGRADKWGVYDYNVSSDGSAEGAHSVRNWSPLWSDETDYTPLGLPFAAGYRP